MSMEARKRPEFVLELMNKARDQLGSDYKLATALGLPSTRVSAWRVGRQPVPIEYVALMAGIANLEPEKWVIRAMLAQHEGTDKGDRLMKVLGKLLPAIGGVIASSGASAHQIFSNNTLQNDVSYFIRCILC